MPNQSSTLYKFYDAYCFTLSPTYNDWVKLTAADVHALNEREGFEGQKPSVYFHLNHPIQWVRLVGVIVSYEVFDRRFIMILDDSSGATIEVTCGRSTEQSTFAQHDAQRTTTAQTKAVMGDTATGYKVELTGVDVGSAVKIKGSIGTFRESRQIQLERLWILRTTNEEAATWAETAAFRRDVLSKPWMLTDGEERRAKRDREGYRAKKKAKEELKRKKALQGAQRCRAERHEKGQLHDKDIERRQSGKHSEGQEPRRRSRRREREGRSRQAQA